jgi:IS30 family transposase
MLQSKSRIFQTITFENGKEFSKHVDLSGVLKIKCYFANPYHSCEQNLNEHTNGLIRKFFRKEMNLNKLTFAANRKLGRKLNNHPRKMLDFKTLQEVFYQELKGNKLS